MTELPHPITAQPFPSPVPPGTGWPGDPATASTPRAQTADDVRRLALTSLDLEELGAAISVCRACPRLVAWREAVAVDKRRSFADQPYWGRPIMGWGSARPTVVIVGLAPAAHGGNRTGRIFTGDRSGDWLFASLCRVGLAAQPTSVHAGDGQALIGTRMVPAVRCAPPDNKPTPTERDTCAPWLDAEIGHLLPSVRVIVCLGSYAWDSAIRALARLGLAISRPRPRFGHGARLELGRSARSAEVAQFGDGAGLEVGRSAQSAPVAQFGDGAGLEAGRSAQAVGAVKLVVLGCFHPSQQNTFTGKLTEPMLDAVLAEAARLSRADVDKGSTS